MEHGDGAVGREVGLRGRLLRGVGGWAGEIRSRFGSYATAWSLVIERFRGYSFANSDDLNEEEVQNDDPMGVARRRNNSVIDIDLRSMSPFHLRDCDSALDYENCDIRRVIEDTYDLTPTQT